MMGKVKAVPKIIPSRLIKFQCFGCSFNFPRTTKSFAYLVDHL